MIVPSEKQKRSLGEAAVSYHEQLLMDDRALTYLTQSRQISREAVDYFSLGVVNAPAAGHEIFRGRISFPYYTTTGVTSIRFRYNGDAPEGSQKFISITGDSARLYNVTSIINSQKVFVCEGETDTITCWMAGLPAVGVPGVRAWKDAFRRVLANRAVVVLADNDDAGQGKDFADSIFKTLEGCDTILMPKGHDVSSYAAEFGLKALREKVGL